MSSLGECKKRKWVSFGIVCCAEAVAALFCTLYLPLEDFTRFSPGSTLKAFAAEEGEAQPRYIYEKDSLRLSFTLEEIPDSSWSFVGVDEDGVKDGALLQDEAVLPLRGRDGSDATALLLQGSVFAVSVYEPEELTDSNLAAIEKFRADALEAGAAFYLLATRDDPRFAPLELLLGDYREIATFNRSNGGWAYLDDGFIVLKRARRSRLARSAGTVRELLSSDPTEMFIKFSTVSFITSQAMLVGTLILMLAL